MMTETFTRYLVVTLEVLDGDMKYALDILTGTRAGETPASSAARIAKTYFGTGRKIRKEKMYETSGGELLIQVIDYKLVKDGDEEVLLKYFSVG